MQAEIVPSKEFLLMMRIMLNKCLKETGMSLVEWLEHFEEDNNDFNPDLDVDSYDDASIRKAIRKYMDKLYPPDEK